MIFMDLNSSAYLKRCLIITTMVAAMLASCKTHGSSKLQESNADVALKANNTVLLTAVRDQGVTGFCWAYTSMAYLESLHKMRTQQEIALSPEALAFYHYVNLLKSYIGNSTTSNSIEALARSIEQGQDSNWFNDDVTMGAVNLLKRYGVVPQEAYTVKFSATAGQVTFSPRAPGATNSGTAMNLNDLFHYEVADNLRYFLALKGLDYLHTMSESDIIQNLLLSRYGVNFTAEPPQSFTYEGNTYTPQSFVTDYLKIDVDALVVKRVSGLDWFKNASNAINTDLATLYNDANTNLHAGIAMPIAVGISDNRMTNGVFTTAASNTDYLASMAAWLEWSKKVVADYETRHPDARTNPPYSSSDPDAMEYLNAKYYVDNYNPTAWNLDGGHAMLLVGPINDTIKAGSDTDKLILKNSWGLSIYGTKDPNNLTSDGLYTIEQGYLSLSAQNYQVAYISPKTAGVAPFLASAGYSNAIATSTAVATAITWCDSSNICYPYCTNGSNTGSQFGWQPDLGGPNGGSCRVP